MFARRAVTAVAVTTVAMFCVAGTLAIAGGTAGATTISNAAQAQAPFTAGVTFDSGQPIDVVVPGGSGLTPRRQHLHPRVCRPQRGRPGHLSLV